jgi:hypothetical protein
MLFMKGLKGAITESKNFMCKCRRRHFAAQDEDCRRSKGTGRLTAFGPGSVKTHAVSAQRKKRLVRSLYIGLALALGRGKETPQNPVILIFDTASADDCRWRECILMELSSKRLCRPLQTILNQ